MTSAVRIFRLLFFFLITPIPWLHAQTSDKERSLLLDADDHLYAGEYQEALGFFLKLYKLDSANSYYSYNTGICYYNLPSQQLKAIPYFERAAQSTDTVPDVYKYLGEIYQLTNQFDEAIKSFEIYRYFLLRKNKRSDQKQRKAVEHRIEMCNYAKILTANPKNVNIQNLGENVNSSLTDYGPIVSSDESMLLFTSRRKAAASGMTDDNGEYDENIFISKISKEKWGLPQKGEQRQSAVEKAKALGSTINTGASEAIVGISPDGQTIYLYRNDQIFTSNLKGSQWSRPVRFPIDVGKGSIFSLSLTADARTIYFSSDRKGGLGGMDLYKAEIQPNGEWGAPQNLGSNINTLFDEDAPFIDYDEKTLYFSSSGHTSMGGFDIFKSSLIDGKWSLPENLGYPINSAADDIYYMLTRNHDRAFFSSSRGDGQGRMDNYALHFKGYSIPLTEVRGLVLGGESLIPMGATIRVTDKSTEAEVGVFSADDSTGRYLLILSPDKWYGFRIEAPGYRAYTRDVFLPEQKDHYDLYQELRFFPTRSEKGEITDQKVLFLDAFFDIEKTIDSIPSLASIKAIDKNKAYETFISEIERIDSIFSVMDTGSATLQATGGEKIISDHASPPSLSSSTTKGTKIPERIFFDNNTWRLSAEATESIEILAQMLAAKPEVKIEILGHTDNIGSDLINDKLSQLRAMVVADFLKERNIEASRITISGKGKRAPVASNETPEGRQQNRRTEIKLSNY